MRERIECVEDGSFRFSIESRRDLVEDDERTRLEEGACKSKAAPLPGRKRMTARAERRGKPRGKPGEEAAERRLFECGTQALFRRVLLPKADVFGERRVEDMRLLRHIGDERTARGGREVCEVVGFAFARAVFQEDLSVGGGVEAGEKAQQGRLARAACTDDRGLLPCAKVEVEMVEDSFLRQRIAVGDLFGEEARRYEELLVPVARRLFRCIEPRFERRCRRVCVHGAWKAMPPSRSGW